MSQIHSYRADPQNPVLKLQRTIDITPRWWSPGLAFCEDVADIARSLAQRPEGSPGWNLFAESTELHFSMKAASFSIFVPDALTDEDIEVGRRFIMLALDALAEGHERRTSVLRVKAEIAAERKSLGTIVHAGGDSPGSSQPIS